MLNKNDGIVVKGPIKIVILVLIVGVLAIAGIFIMNYTGFFENQLPLGMLISLAVIYVLLGVFNIVIIGSMETVFAEDGIHIKKALFSKGRIVDIARDDIADMEYKAYQSNFFKPKKDAQGFGLKIKHIQDGQEKVNTVGVTPKYIDKIIEIYKYDIKFVEQFSFFGPEGAGRSGKFSTTKNIEEKTVCKAINQDGEIVIKGPWIITIMISAIFAAILIPFWIMNFIPDALENQITDLLIMTSVIMILFVAVSILFVKPVQAVFKKDSVFVNKPAFAHARKNEVPRSDIIAIEYVPYPGAPHKIKKLIWRWGLRIKYSVGGEERTDTLMVSQKYLQIITDVLGYEIKFPGVFSF